MADDDAHKILVIFGSESDKEVYDKIVSALKKEKVQFDLKIASAHKDPELVNKILDEEDYNVIIAGAGLSAALPGVVASKTFKPVIGVPCAKDYQGLDALLSIIQMPPGIPVIGVGVNKAEFAAKCAVKMLKLHEYVNIIGDTNNKAVKRARDMMEQFDQEFKVQEEIDNDAVNIKFVQLGDKIGKEDALVIYCALSDKETDASAAINLLKMAENGMWVGLNRGENAALAALEILNLEGKHDDIFVHYRRSLKKK